MTSPKSTEFKFLSLLRAIPWIWLIIVLSTNAFIGYGLYLYDYLYWLYIFIILTTGLYGTLAKPKWSVTFYTIWWLIFVESLCEFLASVTILSYIKPLSSPLTTSWNFDPIFVGLAILVLVKFFIIVGFYISRVIPFTSPNFTYQRMRFPVLLISILGAISIAATASLYWHLSPEFAPVIIIVLALIYTIVQVLIAALIIVPIARAGANLKQSFTKFHTFLILSVTSGLGLGLGWVLYYRKFG